MTALGHRMEAARPDTVVVITPHGIRADGAMAVSFSQRAAGTLEEPPGTPIPTVAEGASPSNPVTVRVDLSVDQTLAAAIQETAAGRDVPVVAVHYGATSGPHDSYPLDWGAVVPLWFMGARFATPPRTVIAVPSRLLPLTALVRFGEALADAATATEQRVALVASADLAHAHSADGPYGFDPAAAACDEWLTATVKDGDLDRLEHPDMEIVAAGKPDGLWQMLVLAGALRRVPMRGEFLSYERPTYYGMMCAAYAPA
jgi:aromatic ring-opening dioxygenase LigB subunit